MRDTLIAPVDKWSVVTQRDTIYRVPDLEDAYPTRILQVKQRSHSGSVGVQRGSDAPPHVLPWAESPLVRLPSGPVVRRSPMAWLRRPEIHGSSCS